MALSFADKFEKLLNDYRKPDGTIWSASELEEATGGFVGRSYISNLRAGRIRRPGYDRLKAISHVIGFPVALWYEDPGNWQQLTDEDKAKKGPSLAKRLELLMQITKNELTGKPFQDEEVANLSFGHLSLEQVRQIREGTLIDPTMGQLLALSDIFGIDVSYWWLEQRKLPPFNIENMEAIRDHKNELILNKVQERSESEKDMILTMIEQLERLNRSDEGMGSTEQANKRQGGNHD